MDDILERIKEQVENNPVVIYMKGTPEMPCCGFSQRASQALASTGLIQSSVTSFLASG